MKKFSLLISLIFCLCASIFGQDQTGDKAVSKGKTLDDIQAKVKTLKSVKDLEVTYDKFDDKTTVLIKLGSPQIPKLSAYRINLMAWTLSSTFSGSGISNKPTVSSLCFSSFTETKNFAETREIVLLLDEARVALGKGQYKISDLPENIIGKHKEDVCWNLDDEQLNKFLNAKSIEFKAEPITGVFTESNLSALKDFQQAIF